MYLVKSPKKEILDFGTGLKLGDRNIGVFQATAVFTRKEKRLLIKTAKKIFNYLRNKAGIDFFTGFIRFDLVPGVRSGLKIAQQKNGITFYDLLEIIIEGMYEVNGGSPECVAAYLAQFTYNGGGLMNPLLVQTVAKCLRKAFGDQEIVVVIGNSEVKQAWWKYLMPALVGAGVRLRVMSEQQIMAYKPKLLWIWADVRKVGHCEVSPQFRDWLYEYKDSDAFIFNNIPNGSNMFSKSMLLDADDEFRNIFGDNRRLTEGQLQFAIQNQSNLFLKPLDGSSGKGITGGPNVAPDVWKQQLNKALEIGNYGLFEKRSLPTVDLEGEGKFVFDLNPGFWVYKNKLYYLHTLMRVTPADVYAEHPEINVAKNGGLVKGCVSMHLNKVVKNSY